MEPHDSGTSLVMKTCMKAELFVDAAVRIMGSVLLLGVIIFCGFGFLASFEYPRINGGHIIYGSIAVFCSVLTFFVLRPLFRSSQVRLETRPKSAIVPGRPRA
jgi:hypothetical protein